MVIPPSWPSGKVLGNLLLVEEAVATTAHRLWKLSLYLFDLFLRVSQYFFHFDIGGFVVRTAEAEIFREYQTD
jgi:hypothetical protein